MRLTGAFNAALIRAVSFDVTGTLLFHRASIAQTYAEAATWARLADAPTAEELKPAFKAAYKTACLERPCFGHGTPGGEKAWWSFTVRLALETAGKRVSDEEFERYFRRVYQYFGSPEAYDALPDARRTLDDLTARGLVLGVTSNTPGRTTDTVLPMLGLHDSFNFFASAFDVGAEKPDPDIFRAAYDRAKFWVPDLEPHEVLHVGALPRPNRDVALSLPRAREPRDASPRLVTLDSRGAETGRSRREDTARPGTFGATRDLASETRTRR